MPNVKIIDRNKVYKDQLHYWNRPQRIITRYNHKMKRHDNRRSKRQRSGKDSS